MQSTLDSLLSELLKICFSNSFDCILHSYNVDEEEGCQHICIVGESYKGKKNKKTPHPHQMLVLLRLRVICFNYLCFEHVLWLLLWICLNVMTIITYRQSYCIFASKFCTFGIHSSKFLAPPLLTQGSKTQESKTAALWQHHRRNKGLVLYTFEKLLLAVAFKSDTSRYMELQIHAAVTWSYKYIQQHTNFIRLICILKRLSSSSPHLLSHKTPQESLLSYTASSSPNLVGHKA